MKGQMYVVSETMVDLIKLVILVSFFLGTFLMFSEFNVIINPENNQRRALDFLNVFLNSRCLLYEDEGGNYYRGIIDLKKLKEGTTCLDLSNNYLKVSDEQDSFESGTKVKNSFSVSAVVYHEERGEFKFGKVVVGYE